MPLILDTNLIRSIGAREVDPTHLRTFRHEGGTVHLADGAVVELLDQLYSKRLLWAHWERARDQLEDILDDQEPVMIGGHELLSAVGVNLRVAPPFAMPRDEQRMISRSAWRLVLRAGSPEEIQTGGEIARVNGRAYHVGLDIASAPSAVSSLKSEWIVAFQRISEAALSLSPEQRTRLNRRGEDIRIAIEQAGPVARHVDAVSGPCSPPASVRLDAMIRVHSLHFVRALKTKQPYNARKNANDVFDLDLLRYLAVPAAMCTADKAIHTALKDTQCRQRRWVVHPSDLASVDQRRLLRNIQWPTNQRNM